MPEEMTKRLFTLGFTRMVRLTLELNKDETGDIYHHPSEKRIVRKCIDLSCQKPLHAIGNEPKSFSEEKWLEAYLIRKAKENNWILQLANRKFRFLYSQLNFKATGSKPPRPLDLLLYEQETNHLTVMELKAKRELGRAKEELGYYIEMVHKLSDEIADVFDLEKILGVRGYIVWPGNKRADNDKHDFGPYGVIQYVKIIEPWRRFKELGENLTIEFVCVKEPHAR